MLPCVQCILCERSVGISVGRNNYELNLRIGEEFLPRPIVTNVGKVNRAVRAL